MLRPVTQVLLLSALLAGSAYAGQTEPPPELKASRANSCASDDFKPTLGAKGAVQGYTHQRIGLSGNATVGGGLLEWCQSAKNAVIYFYVDDPASPEHKACSQNMSVALFPGQGAKTREIIDANAESYLNPAVHLIQPQRPVPLKSNPVIIPWPPISWRPWSSIPLASPAATA